MGSRYAPALDFQTTVHSATSVVDQVRDELAVFMRTPPTTSPKEGVCYSKAGEAPMDLEIKKITVTLKTVAVREHNPSAGLKAPIGVVSFDPKYSGSYSNSRAQTLTIPLVPATVEMVSKAPPPKTGDYTPR